MHGPRRRADHEGRVARSIGRSPAVIAPKDRAGATSARATPGERAKADTDVATARSFRAVDRDRGRVPRGQPQHANEKRSKRYVLGSPPEPRTQNPEPRTSRRQNGIRTP